jgi:hypothetical protein
MLTDGRLAASAAQQPALHSRPTAWPRPWDSLEAAFEAQARHAPAPAERDEGDVADDAGLEANRGAGGDVEPTWTGRSPVFSTRSETRSRPAFSSISPAASRTSPGIT